jgi:Uma2 family endonuclease
MRSESTHHAVRRGRRPLALVVRDLPPEEAHAPVDWSAWYLTDEEDMGESTEQGEIIRLLFAGLASWIEERGFSKVYLGAEQFFAWIPSEPLVRVSPDVYLVDDPPPPPRPKSFQTWLPGHRPPRWAMEIVSDDVRKDYEEAPPKYAQLGARELCIFDPEAAVSPRGGRIPLQIYRRDEDGAFVRVYTGGGPALSEELGAFLVVVRDGPTARLRLARDASGRDLVPTAEERARAEAEARRTAEERVRILEEELARLRGR